MFIDLLYDESQPWMYFNDDIKYTIGEVIKTN